VAAVKGKQNVELELSDVQTQLDDVLRSKSEMDDRIHRINREKADLGSQLDDAEEELQVIYLFTKLITRFFKFKILNIFAGSHEEIQGSCGSVVDRSDHFTRSGKQNFRHRRRKEQIERTGLQKLWMVLCLEKLTNSSD
jgi:hypothetical protein